MNADPIPELHPDFSPYQGLQPYTEKQCDYFFGRERDIKLIISNLHGVPLSVLYGVSGVGKSSILLAGVAPELRKKAGLAVVVWRDWQTENVGSAIKRVVLDAVADSLSKEGGKNVALPQQSLPFDQLLFECNRALDGPIFLIFDQWEEYFLYYPPSQIGTGFEVEFARAVNRRDLEANFMLSMREEELSKLDRFRSTIPNLLGNLLRLKHLNQTAAKQAIIEPLRVYNERVLEESQRMQIEDTLTQSLIEESQQRSLADLGPASRQNPESKGKPGDRRIETPVLQMLLLRLWQEEKRRNSRLMQAKTLTTDLGGAEKVVASYFEEVISRLSDQERDTAAAIFGYLVTPAGSKMAQMPDTLAKWADLPLDQVTSLLERLSTQPNTRILRKITIPGHPNQYEIFHDVLGSATLAWVQQFKQTQAMLKAKNEAEKLRKAEVQEQRVKLLKRGLFVLSLLFVAIASLAYFALENYGKAIAEEGKATEAEGRAKEAESRAKEAQATAEVQRNLAEREQREAERERSIARDAENKAHQERSRAEQSKSEAQLAASNAAEQRRIADQAKNDASKARSEADRASTEAQRRVDIANQKENEANRKEKEAKGRIQEADESIQRADKRKQEADEKIEQLGKSEELFNIVERQDNHAHDNLATLRIKLEKEQQVELFGSNEDMLVISRETNRPLTRIWRMERRNEKDKDNKYSLVEVKNPTDSLKDVSRCIPSHSLELKPDSEGRFPIPNSTRFFTPEDDKKIRRAFLSPDEKWIATISDDSIARVYEATTSKKKDVLRPRSALLFYLPRQFPYLRANFLNKELEPLSSMAFNQDSKYLVTGGDNGTIRVYKIKSRKPLAKYTGHTGKVESVAFSPCGNRIISTGQDQTVRIWDFSEEKVKKGCKNCWP